jgi:nucleoside phosphorylase
MASDHQPPVAVICALEGELAHLRAALPAAQEVTAGNRTTWHTALDAQPIILALCGLGMMSAAAVAEAVIARYEPAAILNYGCAGAHRADLLPGDIVIGARVVAYESISERPDGTAHFVGMRFLRQGVQAREPFLPADPSLLKLALRVGAALDGHHEPWPPALGWPAGIQHRAPRLVAGTVASADRWNRTPASIGAIAALHDSYCEDMEAAAIALTCASHAVPLLTIKDISNNELLRATESGTSLMVQAGPELGKRAGAIVLGVLRELAAAAP